MSEHVVECKAMHMSPPKNLDGEFAEWDDVVERITEDGFHEDFLEGGEKKKILIFLYGRDYFKHDELQRKTDTKKMLVMDVVSENEGNSPHRRILTIIEHETDLTQTILVEECKTDMWKDLYPMYLTHIPWERLWGGTPWF